MEPKNRFLWSQKSLDKSRWIQNPRSQEKNGEIPQSYASFGDNGTTVSVNAYGHIMQISRYFGHGYSSSGFFCADLDTYWGPYYVQGRTRQLIESSKSPDMGIRLNLVGWTEDLTEPSLGFMYDRWPRFIYQRQSKPNPEQANQEPTTSQGEYVKSSSNESSNQEQGTQTEDIDPGNPSSSQPSEPRPFALSIQYFCFEDTVVQQYLINVGEDGIPDDRITLRGLSINPPICIRDLDFLHFNTFNEEKEELDSTQMKTCIVANNSLMIVHQFTEEMMHQQRVARNEESQQARPVAIALIVTPLINDEPVNIDDKHCITIDNVSGPTELEVTVTYRMKLLEEESFKSLKFPTEEQDGENADKPITHNTMSIEEQAVRDSAEVDSKAAENGSRSAEADNDTRDQESGDGDKQPEAALKQEATTGDQKSETAPDTENIAAPADVEDRKEPEETPKSFTNDVNVSTDEVQKWSGPALFAKKEMEKVFSEHNQYRKICFSKSVQLDFIFRRNLEHILSVCCIPVELPKTEALPPAPAPSDHASGLGSRLSSDAASARSHVSTQAGKKTKPIAVTCGDIAGHRIGPRASLSAIHFLSSIFKYLDPNDAKNQRLLYSYIKFDAETTEKPTGEEQGNEIDAASVRYLENLRRRVRQMLSGHIHWIAFKAQTMEDGSFSPHYWPTGVSINKGLSVDDLYWLPPPSILDTPLQLLKISCYHELALWDEKDEDQIKEQLKEKVRSWIRELHVLNERGTYAFFKEAKRDEEDTLEVKYCLTDHVMICLALKFVKEFDVPAEEELGRYYSYEEVRRKILKRFTTENPISKQRMLAVTRWQDETRFLFHSKDAFLLDAADKNNFFIVGSGRQGRVLGSGRQGKLQASNRKTDPWNYADDRWIKLVDAQAYHDEYRYVEWSKPLWYALVLALGVKGRRVNNDSAEAITEKTRSALLNMCSNNGLFPGLLGPNRVATVFEEELARDNYWHSTFEIPYILWSYCNTDTTSTTSKKPPGSSTTANVLGGNSSTAKDAVRIGQQVEKTVPFVNLSPSPDQLGQVVVLDDWLQDAPATLDFRTTKFVSPTEDYESIDQNPDEDLGSIWDSHFWKSSSEMAGVVIDIPRYSIGTEISEPQLNNESLSKALGKQRTVCGSKKRIIWLPHSSMVAAKDCYAACSGIEKENVLSFFRRHVHHEAHFLDSATASLNEWETELHLSFFRISKLSEGSLHSLRDGEHLSSTTMSFHFAGDFSDRYWTCYFLEHGVHQDSNMPLGSRLQPSKQSGIGSVLNLTKEHRAMSVEERQKERALKGAKRNHRSWQQRKVLELLIYNKMLDALHKDTTEILATVKELALQPRNDKDSDGRFNPFKRAIEEAKQLQHLGDNTGYFPIADLWRKYIQILLVIEENLTDNIDRMKEWNRREEDRLNQKPRWTHRDEQTHFTTILRLTIMSQRKVGDIQRLKSSIQSFRESLPSQLESIREDIGFRSSQSINLFTYVTVVFLPLGFATGVLSMSQLPDRSTLINLVTLAFGALGITFFALLHAESVKRIISPMAKKYRYFCRWLWEVATDLFWRLRIYSLWKLAKYLLWISLVAPPLRFFMKHRSNEKQQTKESVEPPKENRTEDEPPNKQQSSGDKSNDDKSTQGESNNGQLKHEQSTEDRQKQELKVEVQEETQEEAPKADRQNEEAAPKEENPAEEQPKDEETGHEQSRQAQSQGRQSSEHQSPAQSLWEQHPIENRGQDIPQDPQTQPTSPQQPPPEKKQSAITPPQKIQPHGWWQNKYNSIMSFHFREAWRHELKGQDEAMLEEDKNPGSQPVLRRSRKKSNVVDGADYV